MSLVKIENKSEYTFIINSLGVTLSGKNTSSGRNVVFINDDKLNNSELQELIGKGYVEVENTKPNKVGRKQKEVKPVKIKRKYTKKQSNNPETLPYNKNSEVIVSNKNGDLEKKRMVKDITDSENSVFISDYEPDKNDINDDKNDDKNPDVHFIDKKENEDKDQHEKPDDKFIEI